MNLYYTTTSDLPISQITPTTSLWLQDGGECLLHCNIRLTHFTDNINMFTVSTGWWWMSSTLQHQTYPFHRQHQHLHCDYRFVVNLYYTATSDLPISQITPDNFTVTTGWWWMSSTLQHQTYPFHRQHQHLHCDYRIVVNLYYTATSDLPISQITPTSSLWLQDGGESLLHCNIRLNHFTDNTDIFTVTTWWWLISTTLHHQTYPFHR